MLNPAVLAVVIPAEEIIAGALGRIRCRRFEGVLTVEKIILIGFILCGKNPSADFRQNDDVNRLVFRMYGLINLIYTSFSLFYNGHFIRINVTGGMLMHAILREHGHIFFGRNRIGGEDKRLYMDSCVCIVFPFLWESLLSEESFLILHII